ncbi:MAG: MBL fold metallo-hydrolase [Deltaproteobacteria bacterium]|nr:MAG: MBL fold metallo-hydrolase [Deltaproteobacteria bacterium]
MKIKWNGHASFTITATDGTVLVTDPYDPEGYGGVLTYEPVRDQADAVLVSHDHADHNFVKGLPGSPQVIKNSGQIRDIRIKGIPVHHDESGGSERGDNMMFVFTIDGVTICFAGDLGHQLSEDQVAAIGPVDLLLIPVGGTYTVDAAGAARVIKALKPRLTIPMHFKTDKCNLPIAGVEAFLAQMENVKSLHQNEIELSADRIPAQGHEVWVMDHAC